MVRPFWKPNHHSPGAVSGTFSKRRSVTVLVLVDGEPFSINASAFLSARGPAASSALFTCEFCLVGMLRLLCAVSGCPVPTVPLSPYSCRKADWSKNGN